MRKTYDDLIQDCKDFTRDESSDATSFFQRRINDATQFIHSYLREYIGQKVQTASTTEDQQFYHLPVDLLKVESISVTVGSTDYVLDPVESSRLWYHLNALSVAPTAIPDRFYVRQNDFGIYPTPSSDGDTITIEYTYSPLEINTSDYTTGTISVTANSDSVTGSGTSWDSSSDVKAGFWLTTDDGQWYKIESVDSATAITLETVYEGSTGSSLSYTIGATPDIPADLHELIPMRVAAKYYGGYRKDLRAARYWENMFWTGDGTRTSREEDSEGGLINAKERYASRTDSMVVNRGERSFDPFGSRLWATDIS